MFFIFAVCFSLKVMSYEKNVFRHVFKASPVRASSLQGRDVQPDPVLLLTLDHPYAARKSFASFIRFNEEQTKKATL